TIEYIIFAQFFVIMKIVLIGY
ncbi:hypothetical protein AZZ85_003759, partial [Klebsiella pneumoniae]